MPHHHAAHQSNGPQASPGWRAMLTRSGIVMIAVAALLVIVAGTVLAASVSVNVDQCANNITTLGQCKWINGIVNPGNSDYKEGMSNPQRGLWTGIPGGPAHTIELDVQWSKGGIHGYDFLTSYAQAQTTAAALGPFALTWTECSDLTGQFTADCNTVTGGSSFFLDIEVPDDPYVSKDGDTLSRIAAFEGMYGNRTIRLRADQPITAATLSLVHDVANGADTGDSYVHYTLVFTSSAQTVLLQAAGHIARSLGPTGWGTGLGAGAISGGSWHFKNFAFDGVGGSKDNQIQNATATSVSLMTLDARATANTLPLAAVVLLGGGLIAVIGWKRLARRSA